MKSRFEMPESNEKRPTALEILQEATEEFLQEQGRTQTNVGMVEGFLRSVKTEIGTDTRAELGKLITVLDQSAKFALDLKSRLQRKLNERN